MALSALRTYNVPYDPVFAIFCLKVEFMIFRLAPVI